MENPEFLPPGAIIRPFRISYRTGRQHRGASVDVDFNDFSTKAGKKPKREGNRATNERKRKNTYNIATWNVRSMYEEKLNIVQNKMKRMDIDILGISKING